MMRRFLNLFVLVFIGLLTACGPLRVEAANAAPDFQQVYNLLRTNLVGVSSAELNSAAVEGLLKQLHGRAIVVGSPVETAMPQTGKDLVKSSVLEGDVAYLHVGKVGSSLADQLDADYHRLTATNKIIGVALDLRFADGDNYAASVATAGLFAAKRMPSLKWDNETGKSQPAKEPIPGPLLVLVNGGTSGAAEALAAALRESGAGLIIGNPTAGLAMTMQNFPLKNGEVLRIATNPVKLGDGAAISRITPDISVPVSQSDERIYLKNPYAMLAGTESSANLGTNNFLTFVDHTSEADLVREKMNAGDSAGVLAPVPASGKSPSEPVRVIQDPVLARALDLIKGLAIVNESHL